MNKNVWVYLQENQPDLEETQNMYFFFFFLMTQQKD